MVLKKQQSSNDSDLSSCDTLIVLDTSASLSFGDMLERRLSVLCDNAAQSHQSAALLIEQYVPSKEKNSVYRFGNIIRAPQSAHNGSWSKACVKNGWSGQVSMGGTLLSDVLVAAIEQFKEQIGEYPKNIVFSSDFYDLNPRRWSQKEIRENNERSDPWNVLDEPSTAKALAQAHWTLINCLPGEWDTSKSEVPQWVKSLETLIHPNEKIQWLDQEQLSASVQSRLMDASMQSNSNGPKTARPVRSI